MFPDEVPLCLEPQFQRVDGPVSETSGIRPRCALTRNSSAAVRAPWRHMVSSHIALLRLLSITHTSRHPRRATSGQRRVDRNEKQQESVGFCMSNHTTHPTALSPFHGHHKMRSRAFDKSLQRSDKLLILNQLVFLPFGKRPVCLHSLWL